MNKLVAGWLAGIALFALAEQARADECEAVRPLLRQGLSVVEIARQTGISSAVVADCQRAMRPRVRIPSGRKRFGAAGPPPLNAAGPPPVGAAGPPPVGAAGPPPQNPAGPPPGGEIP